MQKPLFGVETVLVKMKLDIKAVRSGYLTYLVTFTMVTVKSVIIGPCAPYKNILRQSGKLQA